MVISMFKNIDSYIIIVKFSTIPKYVENIYIQRPFREPSSQKLINCETLLLLFFSQNYSRINDDRKNAI